MPPEDDQLRIEHIRLRVSAARVAVDIGGDVRAACARVAVVGIEEAAVEIDEPLEHLFRPHHAAVSGGVQEVARLGAVFFPDLQRLFRDDSRRLFPTDSRKFSAAAFADALHRVPKAFWREKGPAVASAAQAGANLRVVVGVVGADLQRAAFGDGNIDLAFAAAVVDASAVDDVRLLDRKRRLRFDFGHVPQKRARFVVIRELRKIPGQKRLEKRKHLDGLATLPVAAQGLRIRMDGIGQEPILEKCRRIQVSFVRCRTRVKMRQRLELRTDVILGVAIHAQRLIAVLLAEGNERIGRLIHQRVSLALGRGGPERNETVRIGSAQQIVIFLLRQLLRDCRQRAHGRPSLQ